MKTETVAALAVGALVVGVVTAVLLFGRRKEDGVRVKGRENMAGLHPRLIELADAWEREGTHVVRVPGALDLAPLGYPPAGVRAGVVAEAAQALTAAVGGSQAATLSQTAHGRRRAPDGNVYGWACDFWPEGFAPLRSWASQPNEVKAQFLAFATFARARGLEAGAFWSGAAFPNGDQPHIEVPGWRAAPYVG